MGPQHGRHRVIWDQVGELLEETILENLYVVSLRSDSAASARFVKERRAQVLLSSRNRLLNRMLFDAAFCVAALWTPYYSTAKE